MQIFQDFTEIPLEIADIKVTKGDIGVISKWGGARVNQLRNG